MKILEKYFHLGGMSITDSQKSLLIDIETTVNSCPYSFARSNPSIIKAYFNKCLNKKGWVSNVRIDHRIQATVNFLNTDVAFVLQLGNVARIYADLIKFSYLKEKGILNLGIIALACKDEAKLLGANYANYERLINELQVYENIILTPILVLGLANY
jgi:hypothetical protein